jgi:hypothetical protein
MLAAPDTQHEHWSRSGRPTVSPPSGCRCWPRPSWRQRLPQVG